MTLPELGQQVGIVLNGRDGLDACVVGAADGSLRLALLAGPATDVEEGATAKLEFTNKRGLCNLAGSVTSGPDASLSFTSSERPRLVQRRDHVRVAATIPVTYTPDGERREEGYTLDVSGGGFVLGNPVGLSVGGTTHFTLHLDDEPIEVFGTAVRATERGGLAITMDVIAPGARERLIHWIFRRERLSRAYARGR